LKRDGLEHILRAASRIVGDQDVIVVGSQSILGTFTEDELPEEARVHRSGRDFLCRPGQ
jgi:hypothetical protein